MKRLEEWKPNFFQEEKNKIIHIFVTLLDKMVSKFKSLNFHEWPGQNFSLK